MKKIRCSPMLFLLWIFLLTGCATHEKPLWFDNENAHETVVVVHGFGRSGSSMDNISHALHQQGYLVCQLDYSSIGETVEQVKQAAFSQIDQCVTKKARVNFVGHSLGGLLIRSYLAEDPALLEQGRLGRVVMSGTPNKGSEVGDHYADSWWFGWLGGMSQALGTQQADFAQTLPTPQFRAGIIAGKRGWKMTQNMFQKANDGLVSVDSTKLKNMQDFIVLDVNHASMKRSLQVIEQITAFIKNGYFDHEMNLPPPFKDKK